MSAPALPVAAVLTERQRETLAQVLGDALAWRAPDTCRDCARGAECDDHAADVAVRASYWALAAELAITPEI